MQLLKSENASIGALASQSPLSSDHDIKKIVKEIVGPILRDLLPVP